MKIPGSSMITTHRKIIYNVKLTVRWVVASPLAMERWWSREPGGEGKVMAAAKPNPTRLKRTCSNRTWKNRRLNQRKVFQTSIFNHFYVRNLLVSGRVPVFFFNARFTQGFFQCLKNLVVFSWDQRLHTCAKASNLTKPTQCQKHLCFHITLWNPQPSPWCPSWVFLISWLVVLQLFFHVEAMLFDHQWLEYEGDVGLSEVVGRCFWFMNRLQVFSYIVDVIGVCWLERHLYQFVTSLWFNHVIFYILTRSASARKHVMLVCSWFMLGARVGQLETHGCCVFFR